MIQGLDGAFYGTTVYGGGYEGQGLCEFPPQGCGTMFKITAEGTFTWLHSFDAFYDGAFPYDRLVQAIDGDFYGTAAEDYQGFGTLFKITPGGAQTTLILLQGFTNISQPVAGLLQSIDGKTLYGVSELGGHICYTRNAFGCGTAFTLSSAGVKILHLFCSPGSCTDGAYPTGTLIQGNDKNLYGTTLFGGDGACYRPYGCGTVFAMTTAGSVTTLHTFHGADGSEPEGGLLQATDGRFYGATYNGGVTNQDSCDHSGCGTMFRISMGLNPFVAFLRGTAKVGQVSGVVGRRFCATSSASLNGAPVSFTVKSDTFLTAAVPAGGTTGPVTVTTPSGTLNSNKVFRVLPQLLSFSPPSGPVGTQVTITGVSLTQTTGVGFGDYVPAPFIVTSDTQVTATIPEGAKTGPLAIQTQGGTAISSATFTVTP